MKGSFMLIFNLTSDSCASECRTSLPENCNIRFNLKINYFLAEALTILLLGLWR